MIKNQETQDLLQKTEEEEEHAGECNAPTGQPPEPSMPPETYLGCMEDQTCDELDALAEAHYFFYQMMEAIFNSEETLLSTDWRLAQSGFSQWKEWLLMRESRVRHLATEDHTRMHESIKNDRKANAYLSALLRSLSSLEMTDRDSVLNTMATHLEVARSDVDLFMDSVTIE